MGGNNPDAHGSRPRGAGCDPTRDTPRPLGPSGRSQVKECPCTGTVTVRCYLWQVCVFWSFGWADKNPVGQWVLQEDCPCPE
jgi:hypothetical protein